MATLKELESTVEKLLVDIDGLQGAIRRGAESTRNMTGIVSELNAKTAYREGEIKKLNAVAADNAGGVRAGAGFSKY